MRIPTEKNGIPIVYNSSKDKEFSKGGSPIMSKQDEYLRLRVPESLKTTLVANAAKNEHSLSDEVRRLLLLALRTQNT